MQGKVRSKQRRIYMTPKQINVRSFKIYPEHNFKDFHHHAMKEDVLPPGLGKVPPERAQRSEVSSESQRHPGQPHPSVHTLFDIYGRPHPFISWDRHGDSGSRYFVY